MTKGEKVNQRQFRELKEDMSNVQKSVSSLEKKISDVETTVKVEICDVKANYKVLDGSVKGLEREISSLKWYLGVPLAIISLLGIVGTSIAIYKGLSNRDVGLVGKAHASEQMIKDDSAERYVRMIIDKYAKEKNTKDVNLNYKLVFPGEKK